MAQLPPETLGAIRSETEALADYETLEVFCQQLAELAGRICALEDCVVYVKFGNTLTQIAGLGEKQGDAGVVVNRIALPVGGGIVGASAHLGEPIYVGDVRDDPRYIHDIYAGRSEFAVHIVYQGIVEGVLDSESRVLDGYSELQRATMQQIANLAAPHFAAIADRSRGVRADFSDVIADLAHIPQAPGTLTNTLQAVTAQATRTLQASASSIWNLSEDRQMLACLSRFQLDTQEHGHGDQRQVSHFQDYWSALEQDRVMIVDNVFKDARTSTFAAEYLQATSSMIAAPIRQAGHVIGVLCVEQAQHRSWNIDEASFVATLSDLTSLALIAEEKHQAERALTQSQRLESLGRLAGGIAHEFNNMLTVITGAAEVLQSTNGLSTGDQELVELIQDTSERAETLVRKLMAFGERQPLTYEPVSSTQLTKSLQHLLQGIVREDIEVVFNQPEQPIYTLGERSQLEQVLLNLLLNSMEAMPDGGTIYTDIEIAADTFQISVRDNGQGIDAKHLEQIFDPFFTTKGDQGSGLGLAISRGIVQQHEGRISCSSNTNDGTQMVIQLPLATDSERGVDAAASGEQKQLPNLSSLRVLLVEDEPSVRNVIQRLLLALGITPLVARNAEHALRILSDNPVDVLLTDVIMPDLQGPEIYAQALLHKPELNVLFISGYTEDVMRDLPPQSRYVQFLPKPFSLDTLRQALYKLTSGHL